MNNTSIPYCKKYAKYIPLVRKYLQDIPEKRYIALNPDGSEFDDSEICDALREADSKWQSIYQTTIYMPIIPLPIIEEPFIRLAAGIVLKKKALYYAQNAVSIGDNIEVSDFEMKMNIYRILGEELIQDAINDLFNAKVVLLSGTRWLK